MKKTTVKKDKAYWRAFVANKKGERELEIINAISALHNAVLQIHVLLVREAIETEKRRHDK